MSTSAGPVDELATRVRTEVERAIQRGIKGVEYFASAGPQSPGMPRDILYEKGTLKLYRYRPIADEVYRVPVLLVMSIVNRPYIFDLTPGMSLIEFLLKRGFEVYMVDWGLPRPEDKTLRLENYTMEFLPECVRRVGIDAVERDVTMIGYCFGGLLAAVYAALHPDDGLKNLVCFTTPVDFEGFTLFHNWTDRRHFDVDRLVDTLGNVPPEVITEGFSMLRPISRVTGQVRLWDNMWNDEFVKSFRMFDRWANDQVPVAGECFRQIIKDLMWDNRLLKNDLMLGGQRVDLGRIKMPFLHAVAEHDDIVPRQSSQPLIDLVGSADKEEVMLKGGHVSLVAGANAVKRLWPKLDGWMGVRSI